MHVPESDAEELANDTLLSVSSSILTFQHGGKAKLTTWIFEIAKNKALDFHRKARPGDGVFEDRFASRIPPGVDAGRNKNYVAWINEQLAKLDEADRMLLLWRANGIPYAQLAQWLEITEGAARTRHNRLLGRLASAAEAGIPGEEKS